MLSKVRFNFLRRKGPAVIVPRDSWSMKTRDVATAISFRMGAGYGGSVNRTHPVTVIPHQNDPTNPVAFFGQAVYVNAAKNGVRAPLAGAAAPIFGIAVRPFPFQQAQASGDYAPASIGTAAPATGMAIDVLKSGYVIVQLPAGQNPGLGDPVYMWGAASGSGHTLGGFEATNPTTNGFAVDTADKTYFNGGPDSNGFCEIAFRV